MSCWQGLINYPPRFMGGNMSSNSSRQFFGSFVALITPLLENGNVDFDSIRKLVDWHNDAGTDGLIILGTTGEPATLTLRRRITSSRYSY